MRRKEALNSIFHKFPDFDEIFTWFLELAKERFFNRHRCNWMQMKAQSIGYKLLLSGYRLSPQEIWFQMTFLKEESEQARMRTRNLGKEREHGKKGNMGKNENMCATVVPVRATFESR